MKDVLMIVVALASAGAIACSGETNTASRATAASPAAEKPAQEAMRFMMDQYYADEPMDNLNKTLMTFASYNAGPGRMRQLRRETENRGLDPNVWFGNVERVTSERIGRETVTYVSNIFKYYVTYRLVIAQTEQRVAAKAEAR